MDLAQFKWEQGGDGIVTLTFDTPGKPVNLLSMAAVAELGQVIDRIAGDTSVKGLIITSTKQGNFCAGADLDEMAGIAGVGKDDAAKAVFEAMMGIHRVFRKFETCGKPIVAAINGTALGGGLELTLACHHRIMAQGGSGRVGFPEAQIGLIPGAGGTQRLPRMIGAMNALPLMLESRRIDAASALGMGIVQQTVPAAELISAAKAWIAANPKPQAPWDKSDFRIPGGGPFSKSGAQVFTVGNAMLRSRTYDNYPAQRFVMSAVYEGLLVDIDTGLKIEARYFTRALLSDNSKAMIRTLFHSMQELGKGARRPKEVARTEVKRLGILGAGVMGAGIAYVSALAGIDVTLIDTTADRAEAGKNHSVKLFDREISRGRSTPARKEETLARIHPETVFAKLRDVDLVVEAVFEDRKVKAEATAKTDAVIPETTIFGSNTSTLPITGLAQSSKRPENFVGIHFFSPVDRMGLVEIIVGKLTNDRALATAIDYAGKIRKTPIVVNDSRGFYTSRCFSTYTLEGLTMFAEGITPPLIENAGRMAGMPMGPLEVLDSVGVDTALKIERASRKEVTHSDRPSPPEDIMAWIVEKSGRPGTKAGKGFYDYDNRGKRARLWPGLLSYASGKWRSDDDVHEIIRRLITIQALEAARCYEENVITDPRDGDVGAILGWGFAPFTGGPLSMIDAMGAAAFVAQCETLTKKYGERFRPNRLLRDMTKTGETFYGRFTKRKAA
ncbi:MAG: enoyl-CoA hydratase/isomerase family protein [Alphaproteobacteria bacterium]|nr:enoyl-CoA hydratase/isomerase family protein [Alphaproteobacteria bacterium]